MVDPHKHDQNPPDQAEGAYIHLENSACDEISKKPIDPTKERLMIGIEQHTVQRDPRNVQAARAELPTALDVQEGGNHYKNLAIQPVEFSTANRLTFLEGSVVKRVCRHRAKNGAEDIRKAIHELRLILQLEYNEVHHGD